MKKVLSIALCAVVAFSMVGCGAKSSTDSAKTSSKTEVSASKTASKSSATSTASSAKSTASAASAVNTADEEAWKKEPAYGKTLKFLTGDGCTSAVNVAQELGYYKEQGLTVEGFKGDSDVEAIGTNQVQIAIGHIAKSMVPATNGVNLCFVGGAHLLTGCKALYVLDESNYKSYDDLKGKSISAPSGIGTADYNISARLFIEAGIDPLKDLKIVQVEKDACVAAMKSGEIAAALLPESYGYPLVKQGLLRKVESADGNSRNELCCIVMMNKDFIKENPITSAKMASAVKKALKWMGDNPEDCTKLLMKIGLNGSDYDMNLELNKLMQFGKQTDEYTTEQMKGIVDGYINAKLITATTDADAVYKSIWNPIGSAE